MRNRNRNRRKKEAICLGIALICGALLTGLLLVQRGMLVEARARRAGQGLSRGGRRRPGTAGLGGGKTL